jgi:hypothetical protein
LGAAVSRTMAPWNGCSCLVLQANCERARVRARRSTKGE